MSESNKVFAGSVPENYDRYLVPLIFESFAQDIAQRVAALSPIAVLETAAGTGVVARALTPRLSPDASYVVTDLNQPMLDYAATRQVADSRISWRKADAQALPFEDAAFDVVCCQFGVDPCLGEEGTGGKGGPGRRETPVLSTMWRIAVLDLPRKISCRL
jgi:ubiquinone/menaquinone biosynthesis C-methylase UbiE